MDLELIDRAFIKHVNYLDINTLVYLSKMNAAERVNNYYVKLVK